MDTPSTSGLTADYLQQAENALYDSYALAQETDPNVLLEAYFSSPWNVIRETALKNPNIPSEAIGDVARLARVTSPPLSRADEDLIAVYASLPNLPPSEYVFLAQHASLLVRRTAGENLHSPVEALRAAESAFFTTEQMYSFLKHPWIPYDIVYRQIEYSTRVDEVIFAPHSTVTLWTSLLCRFTWTPEQRSQLFHLIFRHLLPPISEDNKETSTWAPSSQLFYIIRNVSTNQPSVPSDVKILLWHAVLPLLNKKYEKVRWRRPAIIESLKNLVLKSDCPPEILESACCLPYTELRITAASHSLCPDHARVAAALLR